MATIKEVAELANVSVPTVYKVFDENYTTTDEIRKRVLKASKELDYRPRKNRKTYRDGKTVAIIYNEFSEYENDIMQGIVERQDRRYIYVNLGKIEAVLSKQDQMPNEFYQPHDRIKVYVSRVENTSKGPQVFVSRSHPDLLKRLFEQEIPEVYDGIVEIVSVAREAGDRSKDPNIDPVGTCVGPKGQRVQAIVNELKGENMDIVEWNEDPAIYISNALNPAQVLDVIFDPENSKACTVVVPDYQLSLAIGKRGQNARLAAKLTGHKIDIKSESDMAEFYEQQANQEVAEVAEELPEQE